MNTKMIVTDLDSTLLRTDKTISDFTIQILNRCRERGIKVVFATARSADRVEEYMKIFPVDVLCADNGAYIIIDNVVWKKITFEPITQSSLLHDLSHDNSIYSIYASTGERYYINTVQNDNKLYMDFTKDNNIEFCMISWRYTEFDYTSNILKKYKKISHHFNSGTDLIDVLPKPASKSNAINEISTHYGISFSEIVIFGDDYNDIDMLKKCGTGVAVANAIDEAKIVSDYICETNDNDGVAKWIERYIV